jgi:hypothetical protein
MNKEEIAEVRRLLAQADKDYEAYIKTPEGRKALRDFERKHQVTAEDLLWQATI